MSNYSESSYQKQNKNSSWSISLSFIEKESVVLDVGCSSGNFGKTLIKEKNCIVDGLEVDSDDASIARKHLRTVYETNIETENLSSLEKKYDVVYMGDVIEHLVDPASAIRKLVKKSLKEGGKLVFSVPNMAHITIRLLMLEGKFDYTKTGLLDNTHLHFYTFSELEKVLNEAGLEIDSIRFVEKDYPDSLVKEYLTEMGLRADNIFLKRMHEPEAAAFQFVGSAVVSKKPKKVKREQFGPIDLFENYHKNTIKNLQNENKKLKNKNQHLITQNQEQAKQLDNIRNKIQELKRNPVKFFAKKLLKK